MGEGGLRLLRVLGVRAKGSETADDGVAVAASLARELRQLLHQRRWQGW